MNNTLEKFIEERANEDDLCFYYQDYSKEVQNSLRNIYKACRRFGLYASQIKYMLNQALEPFGTKTDLFEIWGKKM